MLEIDRYALHRLQELIRRTRRAYDALRVPHHLPRPAQLLHPGPVGVLPRYPQGPALHLAGQPPPGGEAPRRALYAILDAMVRLMAPVLSFTAEEIWGFMPPIADRDVSVHETSLPEVDRTLLDPDLCGRWDQILDVRTEVTKALETARTQKIIGHPLDAAVTLAVGPGLYEQLATYADDLRSIFIVSAATLVPADEARADFESTSLSGLAVRVEAARGEKCQRCWVHDPDVGTSNLHPGICPRCETALAEIG